MKLKKMKVMTAKETYLLIDKLQKFAQMYYMSQ